MNKDREAWHATVSGSQRVVQNLVAERQLGNVNVVCILYGSYILTLGVSSPDHKGLARVKFLWSITLMIKIKMS